MPLQDIEKQIENNERRLQKLKEVRALEGKSVDPRVLIEIEDIQEEIKKLQKEVETKSTDLKKIYVAIIAMTHKEATELSTGSIFNNQKERQDWENLKASLQEHGITDFTACYEESRDKWKPLISDEDTIQDIIEEVVQKLNNGRTKSLIEPKYLSHAFLSADKDERQSVWDTLSESGGVLIIDAISMCHSDVRHTYIQSQLSGGRTPITIIVVSPLNPNVLKVNELLEKQIYDVHMEQAFARFVKHLDPCYEFGVGNICNLRRWLYSTLPNIGRRGLDQDTQEAVYKERGRPRGISKAVTGSTR